MLGQNRTDEVRLGNVMPFLVRLWQVITS